MSKMAGAAGASPADRWRSVRLNPLRLLMGSCALLIALGAIGIFAFDAGRHSTDEVTTQTGSAISNGRDEATIRTSGWEYGVSQGVSWIGADGTLNYGSWPACLPQGVSEVSFGWIDTTRTTGQRTVVWVRC